MLYLCNYVIHYTAPVIVHVCLTDVSYANYQEGRSGRGMAFLDGIFVIGEYESPRWNLFYDRMYTCEDATMGRIVAISVLKNQSALDNSSAHQQYYPQQII